MPLYKIGRVYFFSITFPPPPSGGGTEGRNQLREEKSKLILKKRKKREGGKKKERKENGGKKYESYIFFYSECLVVSKPVDPVIYLPMIAEGADEGGAVLPHCLGPGLGGVVGHEGEEGGLLALRPAVQHPGEAELRVQAAQEAVEGGGGGLVAGLHRGARVYRDGGVGGGRGTTRGVGVGPGFHVGSQPLHRFRDDDLQGIITVMSCIV